MAKRKPRADGGDLPPPRKRVRVVHEAPTFEEIHAARQLKHLLTFDQDLQKARHGLQSFKVFLDVLNDAESLDSQKLSVLTDFLEASKPRHDDGSEDVVYLADLMDTWSFAAKANHDNIMSAVPVVLALLLKILSRSLELTPHGLGICRTLLHKRQQELVARNLSSDKSKEFILSPTLRLLREVISFDGGVMARAAFRARSYTYKNLARNMTIKFLGDGLEDLKRPSARTTAIRFFLSSLQFLHAEAKAELLSQRDLVAGLTKSLKDDPPYLLIEILDCLKKSVLMDKKVPRNAKARLMNSSTLVRISGLYGYTHEVQEAEGTVAIDDAAHSFLVFACTTPNMGVLREQTGFYPKGVEYDAAQDAQDLDELVWMDRFIDDVPVENMVLFDFIQTLRPWSHTKQSDLIVDIFKAAPEVVAAYFLNKKSFTFEPKLSATWIGYAALLFNTIQLPIPSFFGAPLKFASAPPPTSILLDNIMPLPLTQKILSRCLSQKSNLVSFFATRLLVIALEKLQQALNLHTEAMVMNKALWTSSSTKLVHEFCQRCPGMKDAFNAYRTIPQDDLLHREAASRLLRLYYEVIPQVAFLSKFDVAPLLVTALKQVEASEESSEDKALRLLELDNLLVVAGWSPGMRWFSKSEGSSLSPFTTLARLCTNMEEYVGKSSFSVLNLVAREQQLVRANADFIALTPLMESLRYLKATNEDALEHVWPFLENCASRCATTPIKYLATMEELGDQKGISGEVTLSLLWMAIMEQAPFLSASSDTSGLNSIAQFIAAYTGFSKSAGEDTVVLEEVVERISETVPLESKKRRSKKADKFALRREVRNASSQEGKHDNAESGSQGGSKGPEIDQESLAELLAATDEPSMDNSALSRWIAKDAEELVEEGHASALVRLLASEHTSIRKEAVTNLLKVAAKIKESTYEEKEQVWLLILELNESAKAFIDDQPLPSHIVAFACAAIEVLRDPLHFLYVKVNTFLCSGPRWRLDKFPLVYEILQEGPTNDNAYYSEVSWLLSYLLDGLRTPADLSLMHSKKLFEGILALPANPWARQPLRMQVLRIVYRASSVAGGSDTLVKRFGLMSWLKMQMSAFGHDEDEAGVYRALVWRVWETCDQEMIRKWSHGGVEAMLQRL